MARRLPGRAGLTLALVVLCGLSAWFGAIGLVSGTLPLDAAVQARLPGRSPVLGGLALGLVVAGPMSVAAVLALRRHPRREPASVAAGILLVGWIVVELSIIRQFSWLQPTCAGAGLALIGLGIRSGDRRGPIVATSRSDSAPAAVVSPRGAARLEIELYWIPLGAGGRLVARCGRIYESWQARRQHRRPSSLYHAALIVSSDGIPFVIEMAPEWSVSTPDRGVVRTGPVGLRMLGRLRAFRYEVRCWRDGRLPDIDYAVQSPRRLSAPAVAPEQLISTLGQLPGFVWGRDELAAGEMWNSNSVIAWLLARLELPAAAMQPPDGGRAPGWQAGLVLAERQRSQHRPVHDPVG